MRQRRSRGRFRLTPNGWALAAGSALLGAAGLGLAYPVLVAVAGGTTAMLAAGLAAILARPAVTLTRRVTPIRITVGQEAAGTITVANTGRRRSPAFTAVDRVGEFPRDRRAPSSRDRRAPLSMELELPVPTVASGATATVAYGIPGHRRGRLTLGPLTVLRRDPLGLFAWAQRQAADGVLWVHPRVHPLPSLAVGVVPDYEGRVTDNARAGTVTFSSLREYVPGDDPRRIHWRTTARVGTLIVREHVDTTEPTTTVVLDSTAADGLEDRVELAASVVRTVERLGRPVALHITGAGSAVDDAISTLDRLALVSPSSAGPDVIELVHRAPAGGALVVITGPVEAGLLSRLGDQRRRFAPVVVLSVAPGTTGLRRRPGLAILAGATAVDLAAAWHRLVRGEVEP